MRDKLIPHHDPQDRLTANRCIESGKRITKIALWRIQGSESRPNEGSNDAFFSDVAFYALTDDALKLPDPHAAYAEVSGGRKLAFVGYIQLVGESRADFRFDLQYERYAVHDKCANQTGRSMEQDISSMIASMMFILNRKNQELKNLEVEYLYENHPDEENAK